MRRGVRFERLEGVVLERLDWSELITRYDAPEVLSYLDPPYHGGEADYGKGMFSRSDFRRMADQLAGLRGAFLLSINDVPEVRQAFAQFHIEEVRLKYTVSAGGGTDAAELIVSNREAAGRLL